MYCLCNPSICAVISRRIAPLFHWRACWLSADSLASAQDSRNVEGTQPWSRRVHQLTQHHPLLLPRLLRRRRNRHHHPLLQRLKQALWMRARPWSLPQRTASQ